MIKPFNDSLKQDMMELWKDTFHDSDDYIRLVFDTYFNRENVHVRIEDDRLSAALLGIPYEFSMPQSCPAHPRLRGMYLCGLATRPEYRRRGIMSSLMLEAEQDAFQRGFDMTFLIPADSHLRDFYRRAGYLDLSFRKEVSTAGSDWCLGEAPADGDGTSEDPLAIYSIRDLVMNGQSSFVLEIADWCRGIESSNPFPTLLHSRTDMLAVMRENENSIFVTDSTFNLKKPILAKVRAVLFPDSAPGENSRVRILKSYFRCEGIRKDGFPSYHHESGSGNEIPELVKNAVCRFYRQSDLSFMISCPDVNEPAYPYANLQECGCRPYAMFKFLNRDRIMFSDFSLPVFDISLMLD